MGPAVLNDIGPVIETRGLARIIGYVGRMPVPKTWPDAVMLLREMNEQRLPRLQRGAMGRDFQGRVRRAQGAPGPGL